MANLAACTGRSRTCSPTASRTCLPRRRGDRVIGQLPVVLTTDESDTDWSVTYHCAVPCRAGHLVRWDLTTGWLKPITRTMGDMTSMTPAVSSAPQTDTERRRVLLAKPRGYCA